jgi:uncharacterized protein (TIGR02246 family)
MRAPDLRRTNCLLMGERIALAFAALAFATFVSGADQKRQQETTAKSAPAATTKVAAEKSPAANEAAIRATAVAFVKAFNKRDAKAIARMWMSDGTVADDEGRLIKGRKAIQDEYAALFKAHPTARMQVRVQSVEFPTPTMAIEDGISQVLTRDSAPPSAARYTAVHVLEDGKWLIATVRETALAVPSNYHRLKELGWAVGTWESNSENIHRRFRLRWIANKNFLQRDFTVEQDGLLSASGTQIIGWDPRSQQVVSWTFDSTGGYSTARWSPLPDGWQIESEGVSADGLPTSSKDRVVHVPADDNVFGYSSLDRRAGDMRLPDHREVAFDRVQEKR